MAKTKFIQFSTILTIIHAVQSGNYVACPENYCNEGQCNLMSPNPSPTKQPNPDLPSPNKSLSLSPTALSFLSAVNYCRSQGTELFHPTSVSDINLVLNFVQSQDPSLVNTISGFWSGEEPVFEHNMCPVLFLPDLITDSDMCHDMTRFLALCVKDEGEKGDELETNDIVTDGLIYSCQCLKNTGFENCTSAPDEATTTFCFNTENSTDIEMQTVSEGVIIIDHAVYGKPFFLNGSFKPPFGDIGGGASKNCPEQLFAEDETEFCIAYNTLSALMYWCQGKRYCRVPLQFIEELGSSKSYFVANEETENASDAKAACLHHKGALASPREKTDFRHIEDRIGKSLKDFPDDEARWFWIDETVAEQIKTEIIWHGNPNDGRCLLISNHFGNPYAVVNDTTRGRFLVNLRWTECQGSSVKVSGQVCEAFFGQTLDLGGDSASIDQYCLESLDKKVLEFRFHESVIDNSQTYCPMSVDQRIDDTCFKYTDLLTWSEARRQCWNWGGDLAYTLYGEAELCSLTLSRQDNIDAWFNVMYFKTDQFGNDGVGYTFRPVVSFSDRCLYYGAHSADLNLCDTEISIENDPSVLKRGFCAIPITTQPRTHFPSNNECPIIAPNAPGWPFGEFGWNEVGLPGQTSTQPCPKGQNGTATWKCGEDGQWIGLPNLSMCKKLSIEETIDDLNQNDTVPSEVINKFRGDISSEEDIASGDIDGVLQVIDVAIAVQNEKIKNQSDPEDYADKFTSETLDLLDDILRRPKTWMGIVSDEKKMKLTTIQRNVDELTNSLLQYTSLNQEHEYVSLNEELKLKVVSSVDTSKEQRFEDGESSIRVKTENSKIQSIGFQSFFSFGCILAGQFNCTIEGVETPIKGLVNSVVLGATLFDANKSVVKTMDDVMVHLSFQYNYDAKTYNLSEYSCGYWNTSSNEWSVEGCQAIPSSNKNESAECECNHLTNFGVILDINGKLEDNEALNIALTWITIVGCTLSIISLCICLYVFTFVRGIRGERTTIHRNLCLSLLLAEVLLLSGLDATENDSLCAVIAGVLHFLFLSVFAWMLVEGVHVYYMLVKIFVTARSPMWIYYLVGYVAPAAIVILSVIIVEATGTHGYGTERYCWLDWSNGLIWAFAGPALAIIVFNTGMFIKALLISKRTMAKKQGGEDKSHIMTLLKGSFSLLCILGLTWIFGFTYFADGSEWLAVIFALLNSLQGVFILIFHVILNEKAKKEVSKSVRKTFRRAKTFVTREPYESSTSYTENSKNSQAKFYNGTSSGVVTLQTDVKSVASLDLHGHNPSYVQDEEVGVTESSGVKERKIRYDDDQQSQNSGDTR